MNNESFPSPECQGGYGIPQMRTMFSGLESEWEEFTNLSQGITFSACACEGGKHSVRVPAVDVFRFSDWLNHEWPRIERRREMHRAAVPYLYSDWVKAEAQIRGHLALLRTRPRAAVIGRELNEWEAAIDAGPNEVERLALLTGRHGEELREASPLAGILPDEERLRIANQHRSHKYS